MKVLLIQRHAARPHPHRLQSDNIHAGETHGAQAARIDSLQTNLLHDGITEDGADSVHFAAVQEVVFDPSPAKLVDEIRREDVRIGYHNVVMIALAESM